MTRRHFFRQAGFGIGAAALAALINPAAGGAAAPRSAPDSILVNPMAPKPPMFAPKAKSVIYLFMAGAPSQVDLLDYKPKLQEPGGQKIPESRLKGERFAFMTGLPRILGSPYKFHRCGRSGQEISEEFPHLGEIADDITIIRSMNTTQFNHAPGQVFMNTGFQIVGRPGTGSWMWWKRFSCRPGSSPASGRRPQGRHSISAPPSSAALVSVPLRARRGEGKRQSPVRDSEFKISTVPS